jgi:hypothetical protein
MRRHDGDSMLNSLSEPVERCLRAAGWTPARRVKTSKWLRQLAREGYVAVPSARPILGSLGGLTIDPPEEDDQAFTPEPFDFLPVNAASGERDAVALWERILGQALFPLGGAFGYMVLLVAEDGQVVAGETDTVHLVGENIDDALEVLIRAHRRPSPVT